MQRPNDLRIKNAAITWRNFAGRERQFNPKGIRNFGLILDVDFAQDLERQGWNIRWTNRENPEDNRGILPVAVNFNNFPPKIILSRGGKKVLITEENAEILDYEEIEYVNLTVRPSVWTAGGKKGIKAYLSGMLVVGIEDDIFFDPVIDEDEEATSQPPWND